MPIIYVIKNKFKNLSLAYGIVILIAIFTTAISTGISFLYNMNLNNKKYALIFCLVSILASPIGFANLVKILFPLFGFIGLIQIIFIAKH